MYENYLAHHGIKGQKWGLRRFQNEDGTWTPLGKKRRSEEANDDQPASESSYEKKKAEALKSGKASDVLKFKGDLTNKELQDAFTRLNYEKQIKDIADKEVKSGFDKIDSLMTKVGKVNNWVSTAVNVASNINKAKGAIDGRSEKSKKRAELINRLIAETGNTKQVLARADSLSDKQLEAAIERLVKNHDSGGGGS